MLFLLCSCCFRIRVGERKTQISDLCVCQVRNQAWVLVFWVWHAILYMWDAYSSGWSPLAYLPKTTKNTNIAGTLGNRVCSGHQDKRNMWCENWDCGLELGKCVLARRFPGHSQVLERGIFSRKLPLSRTLQQQIGKLRPYFWNRIIPGRKTVWRTKLWMLFSKAVFSSIRELVFKNK